MKRNAFFQMIHKADGTYLKVYPKSEDGLDIDLQDMINYLDKKKIEYESPAKLRDDLFRTSKEQIGEIKINEKQYLPENETVVISYDKMKKVAKIRMYPPSNMGKRLTVKEIQERIEQAGVCYGILAKNIEVMCKASLYCMDILLAKATLPIQGENARINYLFDVEKTRKPTKLEDGSVDFHHLDMIERVKKGQKLAELVPEVEGTPGTNVCGETIMPAAVHSLQLKYGNHISLSEDGKEIFSEVDGNVTLVSDTVFVSDIYEVPADVGTSTGDIDYDGSVEVKGNVLTGYGVKATGDIIVNGVVEGATLQAGGKIILKRGIQGMSRGKLQAGGDIISNFIESSTVSSGGSIMTDAIMHSQVVAQGDVIVSGKRGMIAGGSIFSRTNIDTKSCGSTMGTTTNLEVGMDPELLERYHFIERDMEKMADEREKLLQNLMILKKRMHATKGVLDKEKTAILIRSTNRIKEIDQLMDEETEEYDKLSEDIDNLQVEGKILVRDIAYPGVKMTISAVSMYLQKEIKYSSFIREGADIKIGPI